MMRLKLNVKYPPTEELEAYINDILENFILEDEGELTPESLVELQEIVFEILTDNVEIGITQEEC